MSLCNEAVNYIDGLNFEFQRLQLSSSLAPNQDDLFDIS